MSSESLRDLLSRHINKPHCRINRCCNESIDFRYIVHIRYPIGMNLHFRVIILHRLGKEYLVLLFHSDFTGISKLRMEFNEVDNSFTIPDRDEGLHIEINLLLRGRIIVIRVASDVRITCRNIYWISGIGRVSTGAISVWRTGSVVSIDYFDELETFNRRRNCIQIRDSTTNFLIAQFVDCYTTVSRAYTQHTPRQNWRHCSNGHLRIL
mmetsp:Transcript_27438/g.29951  ORF Transcript_27438/g.29951 Transcript_27438/m.29951 type:complete len:209 (-) Transcript_27438:751-1377(-)